MNENLELMDLGITPLTRELLINYIRIQYEENADYSYDSLRAELLLLERENRLHELFLAEEQANYYVGRE
ncbi:hypothetical protein [Patiriisocius hiemis]|uniref:Uncharacterized protein n=1 Tax=Patiriisocius hiemis TaxID=3075604 RepID=A0ABU2Y8K2_9FLAO|nr:hypothetical protein [Constantimarinum sp. W242]MDT0554499.1 hypothetical protein [Constantimarinum sp. W242]